MLAKLLRRIQFWIHQRRMQAELAAELEAHRAMTQERLERTGLTREDAARASRQRLGNVTLAREDARHVWLAPWLESVWQDAAYAFRILRRSPIFAASMMVVMALGIGATSGVFGLVDGMILRSLPVREPERLVYLSRPSFSYPVLSEVRARGSRIFSSLAAWNLEGVHVQWGTELEPAEVLMASGNFYSTLGIEASAGRTFSDADDRIGGGPEGMVAVISHAAWRRRFGADRTAIGRTVRIDQKPFTIVGVTPPGFFGVAPGLDPEITIPLTVVQSADDLTRTTSSWLHLIGRLRDGLTVGRADAAFQSIWPTVLEATTRAGMPADRRAAYLSRTTSLQPGHAGFSRIRNQFEEPLWILLALGALLLTVATASAANLLLARNVARRRELAVRLAIGASRSRVVRQMLTEAFVWTALGATAGLLIASWGSTALVAMMRTWDQPIELDVSPNGRVLLFTLMLAFLTAAICAVVPALRTTRLDAAATLKEFGRIEGARTRRWALSHSLVTAQVAITVLLLFGAALFARSLLRILAQDAGFDRNAILVVSTDAEAAGYDDARLATFYVDLLQRLKATPGVASASLSKHPPISDQGAWTESIGVDGAPVQRDPAREVHFNAITPGYFATLGIRLLRGRDIDDGDREGSRQVVVVNDALVRRFFTGENALGRRIAIGRDASRRELEIVGIVSDAKYRYLTEPTRAIAYVPCAQAAEAIEGDNLVAAIRPAGPLRPVADRVRQEIRTLDAAVPIRFQTVGDRIRESLVKERVIAALAMTLGLAALTLASAGLYGLLAYTVSRRTGEIGLKLALGADRGAMVWMVLRQSLVLGLVGIAAGLAASLALGQLARSLLFQVSASDPLALAAAGGLMLAVALCAAISPALRAARVDPLIALRAE